MTGVFVTIFVIGPCFLGIGWCIAKYSDSQLAYRLKTAEERRLVLELRADTLSTLNNRLVSELAGIATRPPPVIDPTPSIRAIGEAIASAYGPPPTPTPATPEYERSPDYSRLMPSTTTTPDQQWFPDVEMDDWLENMQGFPTKGGWVNRSTNSQEPPPEGQTPVHRLLANGSVERTDSQPMFRAGDGQAVTPPGGVE